MCSSKNASKFAIFHVGKYRKTQVVFFVFYFTQLYIFIQKFWNISLKHFKVRKPLIYEECDRYTHLMKKIGLGLAVSGLQMAKYLSADTATTMNIQPLFAMFLNGCQKYGNINLYLKEEKTSLFIQYDYICPLLKNCEMKVRILKKV